jgi:hypothetical protein
MVGSPRKTGERAVCPRCSSPPELPEPARDYAYLLGLYLGDGCISVSGNPAKEIWALRIMCADAWPGLVTECTAAMLAIRPNNKVGMVPREGCTEVKGVLAPLAVFVPAARTGQEAQPEDRARGLAACHHGQAPRAIGQGVIPFRRLQIYQSRSIQKPRRGRLVRVSAVYVHERVQGHSRHLRRGA